MFTTATCPACVRAKNYLAQRGVSFEERDVDRSADAMAEFRRLGGNGVPLILIGNERLQGFSARDLDRLL